ncbi:uncharacterized protein ACLA_055960 [Aspergillus clavatus NRRL 1]|uniref:Uncharacterized protein n=1 Tax=Aspergillus clavatus (strain ATCC 1007 / CBS 513.65 / DSM 816 / NCTC 3887 / NRRL 1 / QM 1276 / 107) TaxID=344612 RepID=A1C9M4_ASPCL|nr:uncharacterized protein ACLA_055960 [Aspergillus clavatus NRRL 1]EAW13548.1 hypothetical protein ACLA_055960 [Aspergillus clavatus NRRL 1]
MQPQPTSPADWQAYANSEAVSKIPLKADLLDEGGKKYHRDVYIDVTNLFNGSNGRDVGAIADVIAFTSSDVVFKIPKNGICRLYARVLTASSPVHLRFEPEAQSDCVVTIFASVLDQPVTYSVGSGSSTRLNLGAESGNVGVDLGISGGSVTETDYYTRYNTLKLFPAVFLNSLETQLRVASVLFWKLPSVATSLASHVALATVRSSTDNWLNAQAVALGQQLAAQALTGPNTSYMPVLKIDKYMSTVTLAIDAASAFQDQYDRFQDRQASLQDRLAAWGTMLEHAKNARGMHQVLRDSALSRYDDAHKVVVSTKQQLDLDQLDINNAQLRFKAGIEAWKSKMAFQAAFQIITAVVGFALAIGMICVGDPSAGPTAAKAADEAVGAVQEAEKLASDGGELVKSLTLSNLKKCAMALYKLYPMIDKAVQDIKVLDRDPKAKIPGYDDVTGNGAGDGDAQAIQSLAAWDKWVIESDDQLKFAVDHDIDGAIEYRQALRKHAVNGKQLAQTQAEAIKAGQAFIQAQLELNLSQKDIDDLQDLKKTFQGEEKAAEEAAVKFYDRMMALRTSVAIEMRNLVWAFKYYALEDSAITIDPLKRIEEYKADLLTVAEEMQTSDSRYTNDYQPFSFPIPSSKLPLDYGQAIISSLKDSSHSGSFTLTPGLDDALAGPFNEGSHFRLDGLEVALLGIVPKPSALQNGLAEVEVKISTSGLYADIQGEKVFHFASQPSHKIFKYTITETGEMAGVLVHAIYPSTDHTEPTPFTEWTITIAHPETLDLTGLTGLKLTFTGRADFE